MTRERHHSSPAEPSFNGSARNGHSRIYEAVFKLLIDRLDGGRVLDIPCGSGLFATALARAGFGTVAADLAPADGMGRLRSCVADMNGPLPFHEAAFDAIVCIEGIEHLRHPFGFIRECSRVVRPGGWLIVTTPNISSLRSRWRWFLTGFHNKATYPLDESNPRLRHHISLLSFPELRYLLHTHGFRIEAVTTNRVKAASWLYAPLVPIPYTVTRLRLGRQAKSATHRAQISEVRRQMMTVPVLFGESTVVVARAEG
jgi:2-polyprenyl-3-methyl-5-hydroxy-6-metoxy-1,4-benzoquinol methylase